MSKRLPLGLLMLAWLAGGCASRYDWPQWRGVNRDGAWDEPGIVRAFPRSGPRVMWRSIVSYGWSSPVIVKGLVYLTDVEILPPKAKERVICLDERTGMQRWVYTYDVTYPEWSFVEGQRVGPTTTPLVKDGKLYSIGARGDLLCLEARSGKLLWQRNLEREFQAREMEARSSPLIDGNRLILFVGGKPGACVIALNKDTGKEIWRALEEKASYSSPLIVNAGGRRQLIVWTLESVTSLDPLTGKAYWREPLATTTNDANASPVFKNGQLLISGLMLQLDADKPGARVLWPDTKTLSRRLLSDIATPLWMGDYIYSARSKGQLICLEAATGKEVWSNDSVTRIGSGASIHLTPNGDRVFLFNERGELIIARLTPQGYEEISRAKLVEPTSVLFGTKLAWTPPSYANGCVYLRTDKELVCARLK